MPEACYDPVRLRYHGWKKMLVKLIERFFLRRAKKVVAAVERLRTDRVKTASALAEGELDARRIYSAYVARISGTSASGSASGCV